jgi:hypothetical protein
MKTIKKKCNGVVGEYNVYSKEEADDLGLQYKHWREVRVMEYALTDDGYVCQLLGTQLFNNRKIRCLVYVFPFKKILVSKNVKLLYTEKPDWLTNEMRRGRTKLVVKLFAQQLLAGTVDYEMLGKIYRPDQQIPAATVKRLLRQERIQNMVKDEVAKELKGIGLDTKYVLGTIKKAIEIAETKADSANMLRGAADLTELLDLKPDKQTNSIQWTMTGTKEIDQLDASMEVAERTLPQ